MAKAKKEVAQPKGELMLAKLSDIHIDEHWNARSGNFRADDSYKQLVAAIQRDGQIYQPVEVLRSKDLDVKTDKPYTLIAGFRRCAAASELKHTQIPANLLSITPAMARLRNLQENTQRDNISTPDTVWALMQVGENATNKEISEKTGMTIPWVTKLKKIGTSLLPPVFNMWRTTNLKISVKDMQRISDAPKDRQSAMFNALLAELKTKVATPKGKQLEHAIKRASVFGQEVGQLVGFGVISEVESNTEAWPLETAALVGKYPAAAKAEDADNLKIIESFIRGVQTGVALAETSSGVTDETAEETPSEGPEETPTV